MIVHAFILILYEIVYCITTIKFSLKQCLVQPGKKKKLKSPSYFLGRKLQNSVKENLEN